MSLGRFIAGPYTATWNAKALGLTTPQGYRINSRFLKELVRGDAYGQTPIDAIHQGREMFVEARFIEAQLEGVVDMREPYNSAAGAQFELGTIGAMDVNGEGGASPTSNTKVMILTAASNTPAATDGPATATFTESILAEDFDVEMLMSPSLREVPVRNRVYPYIDTLDSNRVKFATYT